MGYVIEIDEARIKAIHVAVDRQAAQDKARSVIEKLSAMQLKEAASKVREGEETLTYYGRLALAMHPNQQPARTHHAGNPQACPGCWGIPVW